MVIPEPDKPRKRLEKKENPVKSQDHPKETQPVLDSSEDEDDAILDAEIEDSEREEPGEKQLENLEEELKETLAQPEPIPESERPAKVDSTPPEKEDKRSYRRESEMDRLLKENPQWAESWKALFPIHWLATNTVWRKNLLDALKAKNVKVNLNKLAEKSYTVFHVSEAEATETGLPPGSVVVGDPAEQFFNQTGYTGPYHVPRTNVAPENADLRTLWPMINGSGRKESLLDGGSQIASMSLKAAMELGISYDPSFTITMESADKSRTQTLGLARNVRFDFEGILYYVQLHILKDPAYEVLLGRPFELVSEISLRSTADGNVVATIEEPATGRKLTCPTYRRGQIPRNLIPTGTQTGFQHRPRA